MPNDEVNAIVDNSASEPALEEHSREEPLEEVSTQESPVAEAKPEVDVGSAVDYGGGAGTAPPQSEGTPDGPSSEGAKVRDLERMNKELLVRIRELELERARSAEGDAAEEGYGAAGEESQSVISIVEDLERHLDNAFALKEALEADLAATQTKLSKESAVRQQFEARVQLLEAQAALAEELRDELSFVEEERNDIARKLKESETQLEEVTEDRDALVEQTVTTEKNLKSIEVRKVDLEAQVLNLKDTVQDLEATRKELGHAVAERDELMRQVEELTDRLEASETSKKAVEQDLAASQKGMSELRAEAEELEHKHSAAEIALTDLRGRLEEHQIENEELREAKRRLEGEVKMLAAEKQATGSELLATKKALHDIRSAASRTTKRLRSRYYNVTNRKDEQDNS
jgi:chromosome segregation ATPase